MSHTNYKVIQYNGDRTKRVGAFYLDEEPHVGTVHMHEKTAAGWEDRELDETTVQLLRAARIDMPPQQVELWLGAGGWICVFTYTGASSWRESWFQRNSAGEIVARPESAVPLAELCRILAMFTVELWAKAECDADRRRQVQQVARQVCLGKLPRHAVVEFKYKGQTMETIHGPRFGDPREAK